MGSLLISFVFTDWINWNKIRDMHKCLFPRFVELIMLDIHVCVLLEN